MHSIKSILQILPITYVVQYSSPRSEGGLEFFQQYEFDRILGGLQKELEARFRPIIR